jgi:hypothetical protein
MRLSEPEAGIETHAIRLVDAPNSPSVGQGGVSSIGMTSLGLDAGRLELRRLMLCEIDYHTLGTRYATHAITFNP